MPYPTSDPSVLLLADLLQIPSPSGREERMADEIERRVADLGAQPQRDLQNNVWVELEGADASLGPVAMASHTDELAVVITRIEPDGRMRIDRSGGLHPWKLGECPMVIVGDGPDLVPAHLCFGSGHTNDPTDPMVLFAQGKQGITWSHPWLYAGLSADELKAAGVRVGSTAVPAASVRGPNFLGPQDDPLVSAWILDNRGGSIALLRLLERFTNSGEKPRRPTRLCFLVHEEGGLHGAHGWSYRNSVETFIAVDSSPIPKGVDLALDGRPATWSKDSVLHFSQPVVQELAAAAARAGTEMQYAVYGAAASDASGVARTGHAPRYATVGYPRENSHGYEISRLSVFDNLVGTMYEYLLSA